MHMHGRHLVFDRIGLHSWSRSAILVVIIEDKSKTNMKNETRSIQNPLIDLEILKIGQFIAE